jgi:hypothetical protein
MCLVRRTPRSTRERRPESSRAATQCLLRQSPVMRRPDRCKGQGTSARRRHPDACRRRTACEAPISSRLDWPGPKAIAALESHRQRSTRTSPEDLVFATRTGKPMRESKILTEVPGRRVGLYAQPPSAAITSSGVFNTSSASGADTSERRFKRPGRHRSTASGPRSTPTPRTIASFSCGPRPRNSGRRATRLLTRLFSDSSCRKSRPPRRTPWRKRLRRIPVQSGATCKDSRV